MLFQTFTHKTYFPISAEKLFDWHERPGALERLLLPWQKVIILKSGQSLANGTHVHLRIRIGPLWYDMEVEHCNYVKGRCFSDIQRRGPFAYWLHEHRFHPKGDGQSILEDRIHYRMPLGRLGEWIAGSSVQRELERAFRYRHEVVYKDLVTHAIPPETKLRRILVSGASGLIGRALTPYLRLQGHKVIYLSRTSGEATLRWSPESNTLEPRALSECAPDAVIHLAGEPIAQRWTANTKQRILNSRIQGTRLLSERLAALRTPPKVLICASGISLYGTRRDGVVDETSEVRRDGFLAETVHHWEAAATPAVQAGMRVVYLRIGVVLSPAGGALAKMLPFFKVGLGASMGSGNQCLSWIALDDVVGACYHCLRGSNIQGVVNAVAPQNVSNAEFTNAVASGLNRKARIRLPRAAVALALGEMGIETLLSSQNVQPLRLLETDYCFRYPNINVALAHFLGRS